MVCLNWFRAAIWPAGLEKSLGAWLGGGEGAKLERKRKERRVWFTVFCIYRLPITGEVLHERRHRASIHICLMVQEHRVTFQACIYTLLTATIKFQLHANSISLYLGGTKKETKVKWLEGPLPCPEAMLHSSLTLPCSQNIRLYT